MKFKPSSLLKIQIFILVAFVGFFINYASSLKKQITLAKKEITGYRRFFENYKRDIDSPKEIATFSQSSSPKKLENIPSIGSENIVLRTKTVPIRNVSAPHSPSILKHGAGYLLFFSYLKADSSSHIGCVELDKNFEQTDQEFMVIDTHSKNSADPRIFQAGKEIYLTYTSSDADITTMNIAGIDLKDYKLKFSTELDLNFRPVEKNWVPFEYISQQGKPEIFFQYNFHPHKVLQLPNPQENRLLHPVFSRQDITYLTDWNKHSTRWGSIQGGTPALKIGNKYLAFFHGSFTSAQGTLSSTMGAYTFEAAPPFRITAMSLYPILFSGIYDSVHSTTPNKKTIIPGGFVVEKKEDQELIHLCCGENDSVIKIITFDKNILFQHMKKLDVRTRF